MLSISNFILPLLLAASSLAAPSPDNTCGLINGGVNLGYTCNTDLPCCSSSGYCGSTDAYCLTTTGCQGDFSNSTAACYAPQNGTTVSPDSTCGLTGAGTVGYRCPSEGTTCCSVAGYCGSTPEYCATAKGCQSAYGTCTT